MANTATNPYYSPTPAQLRRIVQAYLCDNCHVNTARELAKTRRNIEYDKGLDPWSTGGLMTGFETGYGSRPVDRDLTAGAAVDEASNLNTDHLGLALIPVMTSPHAIQMPTPAIEEEQSHSVSLVPTDVSQLKDSDGDDVMSPPPTAMDEMNGSMMASVVMEHPASPPLNQDTLMEAGTSDCGYDTSTVSLPLVLAPPPQLPAADHTDSDSSGDRSRSPGSPRGSSPRSDFDGYLQEIEQRKRIRDHILWGRIQEARTLLEHHFPNVLDPYASTESPHMSRGDSIPAPAVMHPPNPYFRTRRRDDRPPLSSPHSYPVSLAPANINLSLRIQAFIEATRTRPLIPPPHLASSDDGLSYATKPNTQIDADKNNVLRLAKELSLVVNMLPDASDRAIVFKELDDHIWPLMAYTDPEANSPERVNRSLQYERRLALADQVNSAILSKTGHEPRSTLEYYARSTGALWTWVHENDVQIPSDPKRYPPGAQLPPCWSASSARLRMFPLVGGSAPTTARTETVSAPSFDFARYLDSR